MKKYIAKKLVIIANRILIKVLKMYKVRMIEGVGEVNGISYSLRFKKINGETVSEAEVRSERN
jgi:hypothetical protein